MYNYFVTLERKSVFINYFQPLEITMKNFHYGGNGTSFSILISKYLVKSYDHVQSAQR